MSKTKLPLKIYILIVIFLCHLLSVTYESDLYGNIFSPIVAFYSSYVIYSSVKKRAQKETDLTWYFLFAFTFLWGIIDTLWLIYDSFLSIDVYDTLIPSLYTFPSIILAGLVLYVFGRVHKKWNKFQLLTDITGIGIILMILIWSFIFSKTSMRYESNFDFINTIAYMLTDFIALASYIVFYSSARKKKTPISFNIVFLGIFIYTFTDFYYAYLDLTETYIANTLIDSSYTLTCMLLALGSYFRSIRPIKDTSTQTYDGLPYNYGNSKKFQILVILPILVLLYPFVGWHNFLMILIIIGVHQLTSRYIQVSIKTDYLLKKEQHINEYLEQAIQEKISDLKLANKALEEISNKDGLTGLYNRRYFLNNLDELINDASCSKFALLYMDMDRFKAINDTHGHEVGDQVLYSLSKRFTNHCKENCTVYRVGGDEFAVIVKNYEDTSYLYDIIDSLLKISEFPIKIPPYVFNVSLSIGISKYPKDAKDRGTLLKYADIAMYEAKISHNNQKYFFFDSDLSEKVQKKHSLEVMLKNSNFDKEFKLYYQPQYRTSDNKLVGMEALLRWIHPEEGFISPADFIPIAEETGIIFSLGEWVINQAMCQAKAWNQKYNMDLQVGINISPLQIENSDFVNRIRQKIHDEDIKPEWIDIEITEGVAMSSQVSMEEIFSGLANIGISISIDDFGTGYSSLSYIKRFDIDRLKIAKELIDNIAEDKNTLLIVKAIIMMARGMGLKTIAEGVEDSNQLEILKVLECDEIQGYIFGRPVPPEIFELEHIDKTIHSSN